MGEDGKDGKDCEPCAPPEFDCDIDCNNMPGYPDGGFRVYDLSVGAKGQIIVGCHCEPRIRGPRGFMGEDGKDGVCDCNTISECEWFTTMQNEIDELKQRLNAAGIL